MPSYFVHEHIALMATGDSDPALRPAITLGSYGPDALYYYNPLSVGRLRNLGQRLHFERPGEFLYDLMAASAPDEVARAYARGFLTHYAADVTFHPFVYALSTTPRGYSALKHASIERALDAWLSRLSGVPTRTRPTLADSTRARIARYFCDAVALWAPDEGISPADVEQSIKRCLNVGGVVGVLGEFPTSLHLNAESGQAELTPDEIQSFALRGWRHPWTGTVSYDGPFELLGEALKSSAALIGAADAFWRGESSEAALRAAIGDLSYLSGINWRESPRLVPIEARRFRAVRKAFKNAN